MEVQRILNRSPSSDDYDALDLLKQDHAAIAELFDRYESAGDQKEKKTLVSRIIRALTVHARIEEGLFYPVLRKAVGNQTVMEEAEVQHALIRMLMADLNRTNADAIQLDAKVRSLAHLVEHHVEEEEGQLFQQARGSNLNLVAIAGQLDAYRAALQYRYELDAELEAFLTTSPVAVPQASASASHEPGRSARSAASAPLRNRNASRKTKAASTRPRRARGSGGSDAGALKGEST